MEPARELKRLHSKPWLPATDATKAAAFLTRSKAYARSNFSGNVHSLADGVTQGQAGGSEFRTAPLWGIGQRLFFLHDGRTDNLLAAIEDHAPNAGTTGHDNCTAEMGEACQVIVLFNSLPATSGTTNTPSKQDILNFLRSL